MRASGRFPITSFTLFLAVASAAFILVGCASTGAIAPKAQAIDAAALAQDRAPGVDVSDTWWKAFDDARLDELVNRGLASNPSLSCS